MIVTVPPFTAPGLAGTGPIQDAGVAAEAGLTNATPVMLSTSTPVAAIALRFRFI